MRKIVLITVAVVAFAAPAAAQETPRACVNGFVHEIYGSQLGRRLVYPDNGELARCNGYDEQGNIIYLPRAVAAYPEPRYYSRDYGGRTNNSYSYSSRYSYNRTDTGYRRGLRDGLDIAQEVDRRQQRNNRSNSYSGYGGSAYSGNSYGGYRSGSRDNDGNSRHSYRDYSRPRSHYNDRGNSRRDYVTVQRRYDGGDVQVERRQFRRHDGGRRNSSYRNDYRPRGGDRSHAPRQRPSRNRGRNR